METLPQRTKLPHETPSWVEAGSVYFITICCRSRGGDQLCRRPVAAAIFEAVTFRQHRENWHVHLCLLMPDHLHALVSFPRDEAMAKVVALFKEITAKKAGIEWQRDFFDHRLRNNESFEGKAHYIRMNPVRKGLAAQPADWPWVWEPEIQRCGGPSGPALPFS